MLSYADTKSYIFWQMHLRKLGDSQISQNVFMLLAWLSLNGKCDDDPSEHNWEETTPKRSPIDSSYESCGKSPYVSQPSVGNSSGIGTCYYYIYLFLCCSFITESF